MLSRFSSLLSSLPVQAMAGKKARTSAADSLTTPGGEGWRKAKGGKRCNAISGSTILKPLLFRVSRIVEWNRLSLNAWFNCSSLSIFIFLLLLLLYLRYTRSIQCLSKLSSLLFVSLSVEKWFSQFFLKIIQFIDVGPKERRETLNRWRELEKKKKRKKRGHRDRRTNGRLISFDSSHFPPLQYGQEGCVRSHLGLLIISRG